MICAASIATLVDIVNLGLPEIIATLTPIRVGTPFSVMVIGPPLEAIHSIKLKFVIQ